MLEDCTMEKKPPGRPTQTPGKGNGTESKKNQDATASKQFPKTSRRREATGYNTPKYDQNRKPIPQKSKAIDKRPRARGQYYSGGKEGGKITEDDEAEYGSVLVQGSKKQNLNHLLNFHYAPRDGAMGSSNWRMNHGGGRGSGRWLTATHRHKYNKEHFLQANCQFVVKSDADYTPYITNPDTLVNWDLIEQIHVQSAEIVSCPICLYPPVAAKMTRCGHVYCWPCILHYLALSDKTWRKCPICYEAVHKQDLKSVIALPHTEYTVGKEIIMRLMKRERGSLMIMPVNQCCIRYPEKLLSVAETMFDTVYSKLLIATPQDVLSILDREKAELQSQLSEENGSPEICFTEQAIELLDEREKLLLNLVTMDNPLKQTSQGKIEETVKVDHIRVTKQNAAVKETLVYTSAFDDLLLEPSADAGHEHRLEPVDGALYEPDVEKEDGFDDVSVKFSDSSATERSRYESVSSEGLGSDDGNTTITAEDLEIQTPQQTSSAQNLTSKPFYFYQASDGQHIYLHAVNVRMLEHHYGSLENCPPVLRGRIVEKESGSMTEELRHRLRYLQHLPVTCQFEVAEIHLHPRVISKETIQQFHDQLDMRRRRRQRRDREEKRREKQILEAENRRYGRFPAPHIRIESHRHFPECGGIEDPTPRPPESASTTESSQASSPAHSVAYLSEITGVEDIATALVGQQSSVEDVSGSPSAATDSSGPSFAQMLREGKSKAPVAWGSSKPTTAAEDKKLVLMVKSGRHSQHSDSEPEPEGYVPAPEFSQSFSDAIALALQKAEASKGSADAVPARGKKKKKQKQKMLFQTAMACSGK